METMSDEMTVCPHCGYDEETTEERFDQLKPGSMLRDRFTVGRPLGRGGFGITYIAWDNSLQRKVAIKEYLPKGMALRDQGNTTITYDAETKEAFLRGVEKTLDESRKLAGFSDLESVVNVYDCFKENGTAYIVMEVLKGENVKEKITREGPLSFDEALAIMTPVLKTLGAVHKTGLIHRDISPDNIYICDNGKVKLLDFGSARIADNSDERSRSIVLKHGYAPKEQYTSKGKQGPYTDIYAVCATMYKMLTGVTPVDSLERIADEDELQDIAEMVKIPSPAAKAIMKGMSVNASDRIQSAEELLDELCKKDDKKASAYYDAEETVTLYVPKQSAPAVSDEPVPASEIKAAGGLGKMVSESKAKAGIPDSAAAAVSPAVPVTPVTPAVPAAPAVKAAASEPAKAPAPKPVKNREQLKKSAPESKPEAKSGGSKASPDFKKIAIAAAACAAVVGIGFGAGTAVRAKKNKAPETAATVAQTVDNFITESVTALTSLTTEKETTEKTTKETAKETTAEKTTLDESKLTTAYIKTQSTDGKVNLRKEASAASESLGTLKNGDDVKIAGKEGDWYKVVVNGKTGYVKAEYITDKKTVPFSTGYVKNGVYYNEWANLKISIPNGFFELDLSDLKSENTYSGGYGFGDGNNNEISAFFYKTSASNFMNNINDINFAEGSWEKERYSTRLAGEEYWGLDCDYGHNGILTRTRYSDYYQRYYCKEIDGYTVVIYITAVNESDLDVYAKYISKIS